MEICGTHTVSLFRSGVRALLPQGLSLVSGPGCPVCVTAQGYIDAALELAGRPGITIATYGDLVRVPGRGGSLAQARARGAQVLVVYSALEAVAWAAAHRDRQVVFLAVGFETTAPATAQAVLDAQAQGVDNFLVLTAHKLVVPAMLALCAGGGADAIDGFLCPGHVSVVIGSDAYRPIVERFARPCVVAGFEAPGMLAAIARLCEMVVAGTPQLENGYPAVVRPQGNPHAQALLARAFAPADTTWRAIGTIPGSGLKLAGELRRRDAAEVFGVDTERDDEAPGCRCGEVIQGKCLPTDCALFGGRCTPTDPVGPCMVSSEGTCAAYYKYGRRG
jgi:hydrogenase expression/formation protein HypD